MTGLDGRRVYLDWNASAPLRPEARAAMLAAMDQVGNPSSVHAEGRAARAIVEHARWQVGGLVMADPGEVVFTSGATEAANAVLAQGWDEIRAFAIEHDCIEERLARRAEVRRLGLDVIDMPTDDRIEAAFPPASGRSLAIIPAAIGETGLRPAYQVLAERARECGWSVLLDATQLVGRCWFNFSDGTADAGADYAIISAHKLGGPAGVGALLVRKGASFNTQMLGGGQESRRRSGTENLIGIAGFGAAAYEALTDNWEPVERLRDALEERLESAASDLILVGKGKGAPRLPNTSCFAVPGWAGETQVMQMDLAGFAVSAGSACSSGKVKKASRVLLAMGFDEVTASSAIRVSMGPTTTEAEVMAFADAWIERYRRRASRAA